MAGKKCFWKSNQFGVCVCVKDSILFIVEIHYFSATPEITVLYITSFLLSGRFVTPSVAPRPKGNFKGWLQMVSIGACRRVPPHRTERMASCGIPKEWSTRISSAWRMVGIHHMAHMTFLWAPYWCFLKEISDLHYHNWKDHFQEALGFGNVWFLQKKTQVIVFQGES